MPNAKQWASARLRQTLYASVRASMQRLGYQEVETPALVPAPGMEPHIAAFEVPFMPELGAAREQTLYLHTSPEYAMKRLLADGSGPIFQICKVFRNGELSSTHNPEFTMLEFYRPGCDYGRIMEDLEVLLSDAEKALGTNQALGRRPYERITVKEASLRWGGVNLAECPDGPSLCAAAKLVGVRISGDATFEDAFFHLFLQKVEPHLGRDRPMFLLDYPVAMAALSRPKPGDASVAERFELFAGGLELANGFSELTDGQEQRRRLKAEQELRRALHRPVYPLDERFLQAVDRIPPSGGVAVGLDRVLMLLTRAAAMEDTLLFPAGEFLRSVP